jgi:hypothetical protein
MRNKQRIYLGLAVLVLAAPLSLAQSASDKKSGSTSAKPHVAVTPETAQWGPPPASLMQGAPPDEFLKQPGFQVAIVSGDPSKPGSLYSVWLKCGDGFRVAPHWHPSDEHLTIVRGTFGLGHGDTWDSAKGQEMAAGTYVVMPAKMHHFGWCKGETIVQAHGIGPFKTYWLNPGFKGAQKPKTK